ncbi:MULTISPECIES: type II restriction endonuclease [unclassified Duganella]|uniref:type II restriction endonuclease n=1 Tax=unclassified Duganella TaxID=2636909 RepID=UPI000E357BB2|nr:MULTISPECIES: type II restriction endonuclease [unclassified Duganella]RFP08002.1 type II restriction endonuclease [Duganella sp. BJB475]RFP23839.1 type II restriction endonuclease [Duganella sp. BJB476]
MKQGELSDYFDGIGTKLLQGTEVDPSVSRGHEFQGVSDFRAFLGSPEAKTSIPVTYVWLSDEMEPASVALTGTWYDSRRGQSHREPEYRLYYPAASEEVVHRASAGDRLFLCKPKSGPLLAVLCPQGSSVEQQLLWLFGLKRGESYSIDQVDLRGKAGRALDISARHILELIDIEITVTEDQWLHKLLNKFGESFPSTAKFSLFARQLTRDVDPVADPDSALLYWMDLEERLFMTLERHIVGERLKRGFIVDGQPDVDGFVQYSLSVQNRRKSRAGWAFANHVEAMLKAHGLTYCREATTEKRNGPDFLFPTEEAYHDPSVPASSLTMLGVKTSCKDRWRQVLAEADRIAHKHLLTLEPGISVAQTTEMNRANLHLVVPCSLHESFQPNQRGAILSVAQFLEHVKKIGSGTVR